MSISKEYDPAPIYNIKFFESIIENLKKIKDTYLNSYRNFLKNYNEIEETVENIIKIIYDKNHNNVNKECKNLSNKLFYFSKTIKTRIFKRPVFMEIKDNIKELKFFIKKIDKSKIINSFSDNIFELDEKKYLKKYSNNSFIKRIDSLNHEYDEEKKNGTFSGFLENNNEKDKNYSRKEELGGNEHLNNFYDLISSIPSISGLIQSGFSISYSSIPSFIKHDFPKSTFNVILGTGVGKSYIIGDILLNFSGVNNYSKKYDKLLNSSGVNNYSKKYDKLLNSSGMNKYSKKCDKFKNQLRAFNSKYINTCCKRYIAKNKKKSFHCRFKYKISIKVKKFKKYKK